MSQPTSSRTQDEMNMDFFCMYCNCTVLVLLCECLSDCLYAQPRGLQKAPSLLISLETIIIIEFLKHCVSVSSDAILSDLSGFLFIRFLRPKPISRFVYRFPVFSSKIRFFSDFHTKFQ